MASEHNVNITIPLRKDQFLSQGGLFPLVYAGKLTHIADLFQQ
jgi:hypothetical protein